MKKLCLILLGSAFVLDILAGTINLACYFTKHQTKYLVSGIMMFALSIVMGELFWAIRKVD